MKLLKIKNNLSTAKIYKCTSNDGGTFVDFIYTPLRVYHLPLHEEDWRESLANDHFRPSSEIKWIELHFKHYIIHELTQKELDSYLLVGKLSK